MAKKGRRAKRKLQSERDKEMANWRKGKEVDIFSELRNFLTA